MLDGEALFLRGFEVEGKIALHPGILMHEEKANMLLSLVGGQKARGTFSRVTTVSPHRGARHL
jgi:hypothetical protein